MNPNVIHTLPGNQFHYSWKNYVENKKLANTITILKYQLSNQKRIFSSFISKKNKSSSEILFPLNNDPPFINNHLSPPKKKKKIISLSTNKRPKKKTIEHIAFNKRLRLFINVDANDKSKARLLQLTRKNVEALYYDYDKNNEKKKLESFSGNNAGVLKNKVLFVKGVMDYMFPKIMIKKMNFLTKEKMIEFEKEMQMVKWKNSNDIFNQTIKKSEEGALLSKYAQGGASWNESFKMKGGIFPQKKVKIGNKICIKKANNYNFFE